MEEISLFFTSEASAPVLLADESPISQQLDDGSGVGFSELGQRAPQCKGLRDRPPPRRRDQGSVTVGWWWSRRGRSSSDARAPSIRGIYREPIRCGCDRGTRGFHSYFTKSFSGGTYSRTSGLLNTPSGTHSPRSDGNSLIVYGPMPLPSHSPLRNREPIVGVVKPFLELGPRCGKRSRDESDGKSQRRSGRHR